MASENIDTKEWLNKYFQDNPVGNTASVDTPGLPSLSNRKCRVTFTTINSNQPDDLQFPGKKRTNNHTCLYNHNHPIF